MEYQHAQLRKPLIQKQSNLSIGQPDDQYEKEADQVANQVMRMPDQDAVMPKSDVSKISIHRKCAHCDKENAVQRKGSTPGPTIQPDFEQSLNQSKGSGKPLSADTRQFMETRMDQDFDSVRVHTGSSASKMSRSISAQAFTHGSDIYFNKGKYQPDSHSGKQLLAHELTHVTQQKGSQIQKSADESPASSVEVETEEVTSETPAIQKMEVVNQSTPTNHNPKKKRPKPWPTEGYDYYVHTDAGTQVKGFVSLEGSTNEKYWCHGHSLGTFYHSLYSVYSGTGMKTAINDEYTNVSASKVKAGDLAVWTPRFDHSAKFKTVKKNGSGAIDESASQLSTKNGSNPLKDDSLTGIKSVYKKISPGSVVKYYTHK